jgi:hypothetical protein
MLTFVWNPHGFQVVDAMPYHTIPKGEMFTAAYDIRNILSEIVARRGVGRKVKGGWSGMRTRQGSIEQT